MAESDFALPKSSYAELARMIHAYYLASVRSKGEPVLVPDVAKQAGIDATVLSRNNKFFAEVGIIEGGQKKTLTNLGNELGRGIDFDDGEMVGRTWASLANESDFLTRTVNAVRIRGGMDASSLQNHIALTAGATKSGPAMTGANAVIEVLLRSGLLLDDGGTIRASAKPPVRPGDDTELQRETATYIEKDSARAESSESAWVSARTIPTTTLAWDAPMWNLLQNRTISPGGPTVNININVTADDPDKAAETVRKVIAALTRESAESSESEPDDES